MKVGRNDPCPCGSGKKYKRCCLPKDQQAAPPPAHTAPVESEEADALATPPVSIQQIPALLRALSQRGSKKEQAEFKRLAAELEPALAYVERQPAIEAASEALEAHRGDFEELLNDLPRCEQCARQLFAEEAFAPFRFTADDVRRAFGQVEHPAALASDDRFVETIRQAILHLADKERRQRLSMSLSMLLPDYVAAGRPLDAWLIQHCAYATGEQTDQSNPFLFHMFSFGYDAWLAEQRARQVSLLGEFGLDVDRLKQMNMEQVETWLAEQQADPAKWARFENLLEAHPEQRALATANLQQLDRDSIGLLSREDARHLLLPPEEIGSWTARFSECWAQVLADVPEAAEPAPSAETTKQVFDAILPLMREMAGAVFTPERLQQLAGQLQAYRNERYAAGDARTAAWAHRALSYVKDEDDPSLNSFLVALCFHSLSRGVEPDPNPEP